MVHISLIRDFPCLCQSRFGLECPHQPVRHDQAWAVPGPSEAPEVTRAVSDGHDPAYQLQTSLLTLSFGVALIRLCESPRRPQVSVQLRDNASGQRRTDANAGGPSAQVSGAPVQG
ncbi:hypothetical protein JCM4814A_09360 [Streptomyces phaeofaciens JCM 4814]|uniref:Uncharacterized protein n=1 Tax=Streptomyces phaeofaciens TaxID=68254 RepID=A0A918M121_9ACTN|nr:hypothetical protein GCM10010226_91590 [Streptomyces phaeofaciens]